MKLIFEPTFKADYKRVKKRSPFVAEEFNAVLSAILETGQVPDAYSPHELMNPGGNYNSRMEFHLSDGLTDVLVIYMPHKSNPSIRFVRMGSHEELFRGPRV